MKRQETTNTFENGLIMDLNPLVTPNNVLTNCLNGTLLTYNGNENVLLNDMGNGRVETAYLPEGYIPLGTTELGGIIYIVSYNPLTNRSQIGSFPSPERNFTSNELSTLITESISILDFLDSNHHIINSVKKIVLTPGTYIHPGDKFVIYGSNIDANSESLSAYNSVIKNIHDDPKYIKLRPALIEKSGNIIYLEDLTWSNNDEENYYILDRISSNENNEIINIDEYRNNIKANYNVVPGNSSGELALIAQLELINTFNVFLKPTITDNKDKIKLEFSLNWTYNNPLKSSRGEINPKYILVKYPKEPNNTSDDLLPTGPIRLPIINKSGITFTNVNYGYGEITDNNLTSRNNDGSDNDIIISELTNTDPFENNNENNNEQSTFDLIYSFPDENEFKIISIEITPGMEFGWIDLLTLECKIDLKDIGSGDMYLTRWKYLNYQEAGILYYGLSCNPIGDNIIESITFNFYEVNKNYNDKDLTFFDNYNIDEQQKKVGFTENKYDNFDLNNPDYKFELIYKTGYTGYGYYTIPFKNDDDNLGLNKNSCYLVVIEIKQIENNSESNLYCYKIMYTSNIFNDYFNECEDFGTIDPTEKLKIDYLINSSLKRNPIEYGDYTFDKYVLTPGEITKQCVDILKGNYSGNIKLTSNYFNVNTNITSSADLNFDSTTITKNFEDDENKITIDDGDNKQIFVSNDLITFNINYRDTVKHNIDITYDTEPSDFIPDYSLEGLKIADPLYLNFFGHNDGNYLTLNDYITTDVNTSFATFRGEDKDDTMYNFQGYTKIASYVNANYKDYDIIPLIVAFTGWSKSENNTFEWLIRRGGANRTGFKKISGLSKITDLTNKHLYTFVFLIRNEDDEFQAFNKFYDDNNNQITINLENENNSIIWKESDGDTAHKSNINNVISNYFNKIYSLLSNEKLIKGLAYKYKNLTYLNTINYTKKYTIPINDLKNDLELKLNGYTLYKTLENTENTENRPINLKITEIGDLNAVNMEYSNTINVDDPEQHASTKNLAVENSFNKKVYDISDNDTMNYYKTNDSDLEKFENFESTIPGIKGETNNKYKTKMSTRTGLLLLDCKKTDSTLSIRMYHDDSSEYLYVSN